MDEPLLTFIRAHALERLRALLLKNPSTNRYGFRYKLANGSRTLEIYYRRRLIGVWTYIHEKLVFRVVNNDNLRLEAGDIEQAFLTTRKIVKRLLSGTQPEH